MATFLDLQNGFYNGFSQGLGFPPGSPFQMIQPAPPIPSGSNDAALWNYFNNIPPLSLTQNYIVSGGNQFFSDYKAVLSALKAPPSTFATDIGSDCFTAWMAYLNGLPAGQKPSANALPQTFLNWALVNYPDVANVGASDLSALLLDPIGTAQLAMMPYNTPSSVADWAFGYNDLVKALASAPTRQFSFNSDSMNANVSSSWTGGAQSAFFGLWSSSSSQSNQSAEFAASQVSVTASFDHVTTFASNPGNWYSSGALGDAFSHQTGAPWNPASTINWENTFGANGNMQRFCGSLVVASGMKVTVTSSATFSQDDQSTIQSNKHLGLWPFYVKDDGSNSSNHVSFGQDGTMTITTSSIPGVPIVLGCNVLSAGQFLGHVAAARKLAAKAR